MKPAQYLIAAPGSGKTYSIGAVLRRLLDDGWHKKNSMSPWPIVYVTKASVVTQTRRVLETEFGIDTLNEVTVLGIDQLRARFGKMFVQENMEIIGGEEVYSYKWSPMINPKLIVWDEGHALKNHTSTQHKIALSYSDLHGVYQLFSSATPATRVSEFKCFAIACKIHYNIPGLGNVLINSKTWNDFAAYIARGDQYEYNQAACDRMTDILEPYIVRMKGIKPQFHARNRTELISFISKEGRDFYNSAEQRFKARKAKAEGRIADGVGSKLEILVALQQYNIAAESNPDRARIIVSRMIEDVKNGFSPACAFKHKISVSKCLKLMFDEFKVPRSLVSVIWGGGAIKLTDKAKAKKAITGNSDLEEALAAKGITLEGIGLDVDIQEEIKFPPEFKLGGTQTQEQRQIEIDRFQKGLTRYCFFTMKSGGVGLSLHHTDAMLPLNQRARRKESGYVYEEDIPKIPTRPRKLYSAPNYSAIDMVQVLGRCPRITSLSDTEQILLFFRGTIEEDVEFICNNKLRCLSKVVRNPNDSWEQLLVEDRSKMDKYKQQVASESSSDDPDELIDGIESEEE